MELDDLSSRKSIQRIQGSENASENASEHPAQCIRKTVEQAEGERDVLVEHPPDEVVQDLGSSEQLPSTPPNIITTPRNTENPILRFIIFLSPQKWWSRHISLVVLRTSDALTGGDPRDYLSLERTFLAYIRTASALVSLGVIVTQLFLLKKVSPRDRLYYGIHHICRWCRDDVDWMFEVFQAAEIIDIWEGDFCWLGYCNFVVITFGDFYYYVCCFACSGLKQLLCSVLLLSAGTK